MGLIRAVVVLAIMIGTLTLIDQTYQSYTTNPEQSQLPGVIKLVMPFVHTHRVYVAISAVLLFELFL